ncbi:DUF397 domain-containing protein [Streptomyces sp. NBC_00425]|uniref:DUF397 domain-containing protein n=1 Tax=Streptomyces sp. NBC_00425 TaxID=2975740 RepID=UPI002E22DF7F
MQQNQDLYALSLDGAEFTALCGGNQGGDNEQCVELAAIPGAVDAFAVRDSKNPAAGVLRFTGAELRELRDAEVIVSA